MLFSQESFFLSKYIVPLWKEISLRKSLFCSSSWNIIFSHKHLNEQRWYKKTLKESESFFSSFASTNATDISFEFSSYWYFEQAQVFFFSFLNLFLKIKSSWHHCCNYWLKTACIVTTLNPEIFKKIPGRVRVVKKKALNYFVHIQAKPVCNATVA